MVAGKASAQTVGELTETIGFGFTVKTTSSLLLQPKAVSTVRRNVTDGLLTLTVVVKEPGVLMVAVPDPGTTLQVVVVTLSPGAGVAVPETVKLVEDPSEHLL